jgi:hypothetical protein
MTWARRVTDSLFLETSNQPLVPTAYSHLQRKLAFVATLWEQDNLTEGLGKMHKTAWMKLRLEPEEKEAFEQAADLAGAPLSVWVRERLRRAARRELDEEGKPVPFLRHVRLD